MKEYQPFTYLIKFKETGQLYYGSKTAKGCHPDDLWTKYFTTSKVVESLISEYNKESFEIIHIKLHATKEAALKWETMYLISVDAARNENYLNKTNGGNNFVGISHSEEWKIEMSIRNSADNNPFYGKTHTDETRNILSKINSGESHPQYGTHQSDSDKQLKRESHLGEKSVNWGKFGKDSNSAKSYIITFPDGHEENIIGLNQFCREYNLQPSSMTCRGKSKGFRCRHAD